MWVIAHRGASAFAPENTMAAFRRAVDMGARFIETDLQLTRDAHLVALHDDTLDRTTDGQGPVGNKTLDEVRKLDAGAWFAQGAVKKGEFAGQRVPTVEEILTFGREKDVGLYLELKPLGASGAELAIVGALRASGEIGRTVVLSFDPGSLLRVRKFDPTMETGYLYSERLSDAVPQAMNAGARQLLPRVDRITPALVNEAHQNDLKVVAWTVNERQKMQELMRVGVDGIVTNYPNELVALLAGE